MRMQKIQPDFVMDSQDWRNSRKDAAEKCLFVVKSIVLAMTKDVCYSDQRISPNSDKMENNDAMASLEDAKIFEGHPCAEGRADQHTDQHHDLLPICGSSCQWHQHEQTSNIVMM